MDEGEKKIKQEDCSEDNLGSGILTLTNKRLAFDKTRARMMDFSKHMGDTILDVSLDDVVKTWKEGLLIKKVCFTAKTEKDEQTYKFGVFNTKSWFKSIDEAINNYKNQ
jgi:exonuclease VII small subunit